MQVCSQLGISSEQCFYRLLPAQKCEWIQRQQGMQTKHATMNQKTKEPTSSSKESVSRTDSVDILTADIENSSQFGVVSGGDVDKPSPEEVGLRDIDPDNSSNSGAVNSLGLIWLTQTPPFFRGVWSAFATTLCSVSEQDLPEHSCRFCAHVSVLFATPAVLIHVMS